MKQAIRQRVRLTAIVVGLILTTATCASQVTLGGAETTIRATSGSTQVPSTDSTTSDTADTAPVAATDCPALEVGVQWEITNSTSLDLIHSSDGVDVYAAEYPLPGPTDGLWSQWGQGVVGADGRHFSAVGDHLGADGNSYFFVYDPDTREVSRFMDVLSVIDRPPGSWGFGKVHAQMVVDRCDRIWAATYWGTRSGITDYEGDHLLLIDPIGKTVTDAGVFSDGLGIPSMTITSDRTVIVAEAVDPESDKGRLISWEIVGSAPGLDYTDPSHLGFRALATSGDGQILFSVGSGRLAAWDVGTGANSVFTEGLPGDWLRAATVTMDDGTFVGVTQDPPKLFRLSSDGEETFLGDPGGYTTSLALDEPGQRVFWMSGAHGNSWETGAAIKSLDLVSGEITEVVRLREAFEGELDLLPGGTYSIVYDAGRLILGVNASKTQDDNGFGNVVLVVVEGL
ncbi:MAG: hypothetical protein WBM90_13475 [Acidimicrobiia bacterium]